MRRLFIYQFGILGLLIVLFSFGGVWAQADDVTVPDVVGLNPPQAAAALNAVGLRLGEQTVNAWTASSEQEPGSISGQSIAAGEVVSPGTAVDIVIATTTAIRLIYDDNDLTLINNTGAPFDLTTVVFNGAEGNQQFAASRWTPVLPAGDCTQIWSVRRSGAKDIAECGSIVWQTTNDPADHFWTQTSGASAFNVVQNGTVVATCDAAPLNSQATPLTCEFVVVNATANNPLTQYVYFAYTPDRFTAVNGTSDRWMVLNGTQVQAPGIQQTIGDPALFGNQDIVGDVRYLAPGQCSLLTLSPLTDASPPQACDVIAQQALPAAQAFWTVPFEVVADTRPGETLSCPAATEDRMTICVMPR
jgi:hypothetical protein